MKQTKIFIGTGIDVSKAKLDVVMIGDEGEISHFIFKNNENGLKEMIKKFKGYNRRIVMESTGRFHLLCALKLSEAGFDVRVLNPIVSSRYMKAGIRKNKTDKIDACGLAEMAIIGRNLPAPFKAGILSIHIRQKIGLISSMEKQIQTLRAIYNGYREFQENTNIQTSETEREIEEAVKSLKATKKKMEKEIETLILETQSSRDSHNIITSVPGISQYVASLILQFFDTEYNNSPKQWIAYAGMDIYTRESGQWCGRCKMSKRGNAYLRKRLFSAAWGAVMNHQEFKKYYDGLKDRGRRHTEALIIIARKLIRIIFFLLKKNLHFNEQLCFFS